MPTPVEACAEAHPISPSEGRLTIAPELRRQLAIKAWILGILALGFVVSVSIPKLAIIRLGEVRYGVYALIVGFSGVLAFADLGLLPGLIRSLAQPIANGDHPQLRAKLRIMDRLAFTLLILLVTGCGLLMYWSLPAFTWNALHALIVFAAATYLYIRADIRSAMLRVSGAVSTSYALRALYLLVYLATIIILYCLLKVWAGVWLICYAQLLASCVYFVSIKFFLKRAFAAFAPPSLPTCDPAKPGFWKEVWRVSSPERLNRVIQLIMGAVERPLLIATAGLAMVTSYDLLMRLVLLVSAVPGALNHPLLAMLAHDSVRESRDRKFPLALRMTKIASVVCAGMGLIACMVLWGGFHHRLFGISSRIPVGVGIVVAVVAAINIQTAPECAALTAEGIVWPINTKLYVEVAGIIVGGIFAFWLRNGLLFIVIRYCALGLSATGFLLFGARFGRLSHERQKEACCAGD